MDLIERQAAIDALMKRDKELRNINWYDKPFAEGECKGIDYALEIVNALPSVQPTQSNASNALKTLDCIDRQAAIDELDPLFESLAIDKIKALPSVQPLVIHCTDCEDWLERQSILGVTISELPSVQPQTEWNNHTVACLLAELFGDACACNYNGIDEWLPEKCEVIDACPNPVGVACWEQFLKHRAERREHGSD